MLYSQVSKNGTNLNGIQATSAAPANGQTPTTPFRVDQGETLHISHQESFAVAATFAGVAAYGLKMQANGVALIAAAIINQTTPNVTIGDAGAIAYSGAGDTTVTFGSETGVPFLAPFLFSVLDLAVLATKTNNFTLTLGPGREIYNFTVLPDNSVKLYVRNGVAWDLVNTFPIGHAIVASDTVSYKVSDEKIELLINGVSVWNKVRTWTLLLSSSDLGTLSAQPPYNFGQTVDLVIGFKSGDYTLSFHDQEGPALKIDQMIQVTTDKVVITNPAPDLTVPLVAAALINSEKPAVVVPVVASGPDWGKILTWGGIALAGIVVVAGLMWAIRGKK